MNSKTICVFTDSRHRPPCRRAKKRIPPRSGLRAVSVYGMGRFSVTLYKEQWLKLLDMAAEIRAFIAANESQLKAKE